MVARPTGGPCDTVETFDSIGRLSIERLNDGVADRELD